MKKTIIEDRYYSTQDVIQIARHSVPVELSNDKKWIKKIKASRAYLDKLLEQEHEIYGVTTGYGDSCTTSVPFNLIRGSLIIVGCQNLAGAANSGFD